MTWFYTPVILFVEAWLFLAFGVHCLPSFFQSADLSVFLGFAVSLVTTGLTMRQTDRQTDRLTVSLARFLSVCPDVWLRIWWQPDFVQRQKDCVKDERN